MATIGMDNATDGLAPPTRLTRASKTSERLASAIVADIIANRLTEGDRLPNEGAMLERLQAGRGSLREALRILEVHGLISLKTGPGGGPVILAVDPRDVGRAFSLYLHLRGGTVQELIETRLLIDPLVARMAAEHADVEGLARLEHALATETAAGDGEGYLHAANDFHYVLASMTGNRVFDLVATALKELYTSRVVGGGIAGQTTRPDIRLEHGEIGAAILAGEGAKAELLMRRHVERYPGRINDLAPSFAESTITWD